MRAAREAIRSAVRDRLVGDSEGGAYATRAEGRVWASHTVAAHPGDFPIILVYTREETREREAWPGGPDRRRLSLAVEIYTAGPRADDHADWIAEEAETALVRDPTLGGLAESLDYRSSETELGIHGQGEPGEMPFLVMTQMWDIVYRTADRRVPDTAPVLSEAMTTDAITALVRERLPADPDMGRVAARRLEAVEAYVADAPDPASDGDSFDPTAHDPDAATPFVVVRQSWITVHPAWPVGADPAQRPDTVYLGHAPEIGPAHEPDYEALIRNG
ncbi:hypothetical protein [Fodinicurvata sp. EGI_FJ10296]|uniref:hypothetical protein n=1 Tax=Fodinicurvata sp. EGI_FJ10296 TaxID=3231908 RepID=UPI0034524F89